MEGKAAVEFNAVDNAVNKPYDGDGDGNLSDVEKACKKYDTNGDGVFSLHEVEAVVRDMKEAEKEAKNMGRLAVAAAIVGLLVCGALLGLMFAANEASKESHVKGSVLVDLSGNPTQTKPVSSVVTLVDLPKLATKLLDEVKFVSFTAYRTKNNANLPISREESIKEFGEANIRLNVDGYVKTNAAVTLETAKGPLVISNNGSPPQYNDYRVIITEPTRRLSEEHGNQARLYSTVDELLSHERRHGRHLTDNEQSSTVSINTAASNPAMKSRNFVKPMTIPEQKAQLQVRLSFTKTFAAAGYTPETFGDRQRTATTNILRDAGNCKVPRCEITLKFSESLVGPVPSHQKTCPGGTVIATLTFENMKMAKEAKSLPFFLPGAPLSYQFATRFKEIIKDTPEGFGVLPLGKYDVWVQPSPSKSAVEDFNKKLEELLSPAVQESLLWTTDPMTGEYTQQVSNLLACLGGGKSRVECLEAPTKAPTLAPTKAPTKAPTLSPTEAPTKAPTLSPTKAPTKAPTLSPTKAPTKAPTLSPTKAPTKAPTLSPTKAPTKAPTLSPTKAPTKAPTLSPAEAPTAVCSACIVAYLNSTEAATSPYATGSYV